MATCAGGNVADKKQRNRSKWGMRHLGSVFLPGPFFRTRLLKLLWSLYTSSPSCRSLTFLEAFLYKVRQSVYRTVETAAAVGSWRGRRNFLNFTRPLFSSHGNSRKGMNIVVSCLGAVPPTTSLSHVDRRCTTAIQTNPSFQPDHNSQTIDVNMAVIRGLRVAWRFQPPICFPAVKQV
jgi:hypothetical protein